MDGGLETRLVNRRIQAEVADQLLRFREALDIADGGKQPHGHGRVHAGDTQQQIESLILEHGLRQSTLDSLQITAQPVQFTQSLFHCYAFISGKGLMTEPGASRSAKQVGCRTRFDQVGDQYGVNLILQPGSLANDLRSAGHLPTHRLGRFIRNPDLGQKAACVKLRQNGRIDLVGLDPRLGNQTHL